jgi:hypothetical protein
MKESVSFKKIWVIYCNKYVSKEAIVKFFSSYYLTIQSVEVDESRLASSCHFLRLLASCFDKPWVKRVKADRAGSWLTI